MAAQKAATTSRRTVRVSDGPCYRRERIYIFSDGLAPARIASVLNRTDTVGSGQLDFETSKQKDRRFARPHDTINQSCEPARVADFAAERRNCEQVLQDFPSVDMPLAELLDAAPRLKPRQFSLASSPLAHGAKLHVCVAEVDFKTPFKRRVRGLCSSWLASLQTGYVRSGRRSLCVAACFVPECSGVMWS